MCTVFRGIQNPTGKRTNSCRSCMSIRGLSWSELLVKHDWFWQIGFRWRIAEWFTVPFLTHLSGCELRPVAEPVHSTGHFNKLCYVFRIGFELSLDYSKLMSQLPTNRKSLHLDATVSWRWHNVELKHETMFVTRNYVDLQNSVMLTVFSSPCIQSHLPSLLLLTFVDFKLATIAECQFPVHSIKEDPVIGAKITCKF